MQFFIILFAVLSGTVALTSELYNVDKQTGLKFFWHGTENGSYVKAFLEGGPASVLFATEDDVQFYLYTKANSGSPQELKPGCDSCLDGSNYIRSAPLKIIAHGFMSDYLSDINQVMRDAYFRLGADVNIIIVNWEKLAAAPWYDTAAENTKPVGQYVAALVDYLVTKGVATYAGVHFSGHSLGAHVGGYVRTSSKIDRITAMDPALPLFGARGDEDRIDSSDAVFVDVIHTSGGSLAFAEPRGHVDYYPNGGEAYQPGCGIDIIATCSHGRAYEYMAETIWHPKGFPAYKCDTWEHYEEGRCALGDKEFMGEPSSKSARGNYYLRTNQNPPYGQE